MFKKVIIALVATLALISSFDSGANACEEGHASAYARPRCSQAAISCHPPACTDVLPPVVCLLSVCWLRSVASSPLHSSMAPLRRSRFCLLLEMSALGHKRTWRRMSFKSALDP